MIAENRMVADPIGWTGAFFEAFATYLLIWPADGIVTKESLRKIYDGSLFYDVAAKRRQQGGPHLMFSGLRVDNSVPNPS